MFKLISQILFRLSGWRAMGSLPVGIDKCVLVAAPHSSNHDFVLARAGCYILDVDIKYLIKKEWMFFPLNLFFKAMGAVPVERKKIGGNMVDQLVNQFNKTSKMALLVSPEGTRKNTTRWKTGFYHIAMGAGVPIVLCYLDYKKKIAGIGPVIYPTGDYAKDMEKLKQFYQHITPKYPVNYSLDIT